MVQLILTALEIIFGDEEEQTEEQTEDTCNETTCEVE